MSIIHYVYKEVGKPPLFLNINQLGNEKYFDVSDVNFCVGDMIDIGNDMALVKINSKKNDILNFKLKVSRYNYHVRIYGNIQILKYSFDNPEKRFKVINLTRKDYDYLCKIMRY